MSRKFSKEDVRMALQFAAITGVILPLVPNENWGPFRGAEPAFDLDDGGACFWSLLWGLCGRSNLWSEYGNGHDGGAWRSCLEHRDNDGDESTEPIGTLPRCTTAGWPLFWRVR